MNTLVIYAHPNPASFNAAIRDTVTTSLEDRGHTVRVKDLYGLEFQPALSRADLDHMMNPDRSAIAQDIEKEQSDLAWARKLVFIYAVWWFDCTAILKGWLGRVFTRNGTRTLRDEPTRGLLHLDKVLILQTTGLKEDGIQRRELLELIDRPTLCWALTLIGAENVECMTFFGIPLVSHEERQAMLAGIREHMRDF
jgi:NAD(P)H dehydrogenase (quinone)